MSYYSTENYYQILGISPGATESELKQAYRRKAKQLHPDRNKSPYAQQDFISLTEAYDYLMHHRTETVAEQTYSSYTTHTTYQTSDTDTNADEQARAQAAEQAREEVRQRARARAAQQAEMRYEDFIDSDDYRSLMSIEIIIRYFFLLAILLFVVGIFTVLIITSGVVGLMFGLFFLATPGGLLYIKFKEEHFDFIELHEAIVFVLHRRWFQTSIITLLNVFLFFHFGCHTHFLSPDMSLPRRRLFTFCFAPLLMGCFFAINYLLCGQSVSDTFMFEHKRDYEPHFFYELYLPDNKFADYPYIRNFPDEDSLRHNNAIEYTTAKGLFGIPVMTRSRFLRKDI
jgi:DnaJ domain